MACIKFKSSQKNNKWREVELDLEKERSSLKYFGVDTRTKVNELLQNNLTMFDWIQKNQGFPYFIGRWISGDNPLDNEEIDFIESAGSKILPILKPISKCNGKESGDNAIEILRNLRIKKNTPVFVEVDTAYVTSEYLTEYARTILEGGYIPGFYTDTDSFYEFDRQFSRAYQSDVELMKLCKLWALSPEMEEFFETKNSHNQKPDFWAPFAPSCITKEQIMIWQYGKKAHPVNAYNGKRTDFNLNLTIDPINIFNVLQVNALNFDFKDGTDREKIQFEACVTDGEVIETVSLECGFITAQSPSLLVNNKTYAKHILSNHKILEFVICRNNDLLSPKCVVYNGSALVKLVFVSNERSYVYDLKMVISLEECEALKKILQSCSSTEDSLEIQNMSYQEMWRLKFFREGCIHKSSISEENEQRQVTASIRNYFYKPYENIFESELASAMLMRSSISGDTYNIFATIPEDAVKSVGTQYCTIKDVNGYPASAYYKDTMYHGQGCYISKIGIWDLDPSIQYAANSESTSRLVQFKYQKAYNAFVYYYSDTDEIQVVYSAADQTYVVTSQTQISLNLVGCQTAYIDKCSFEVGLGGDDTENVDYMDSVLSILDWAVTEPEILGKIASKFSNIADVFGILDDISDILMNYNYNVATHEYVFYPECNLVTKQVGSTFEPILANKNSLLKIRSTLKDVTVYPTSKIYCQIQTKVLSTFAGNNEYIYMGGSVPLQ